MTYYGDTETWSHSVESLPTSGWSFLSLPYFHIYLQWTYSYFCSCPCFWPHNLLFFILSSTLFLSNKAQNSFHSKVLVLQSQPNNAGSSPPPNEYHLWASWQKDTERFTFLFQEVEFSLKVWTNHWMKQNFTVIIMWANAVLWSRRIWL